MAKVNIPIRGLEPMHVYSLNVRTNSEWRPVKDDRGIAVIIHTLEDAQAWLNTAACSTYRWTKMRSYP